MVAAQSWVESCVIQAELAADGRRVILAPGGDLATAASALRSLTVELRHTEPRGLLQTDVSWPLVIQLATTFGPFRHSSRPVEPGDRAGVDMGPRLMSWIAAESARRTTLAPLTAVVNEGAPPPRDYQRAAAQMISATGRVMLFDEMGTGKTVSALLGLMELAATGRISEHDIMLVVCPASVVDSWVAAAFRWTPFHPVAYRGAQADRKRLLRAGNLVVASYGVVTRDAAGPLLGASPKALVVDELHSIKDPDAKRSRAVRLLAPEAEFFIALSGTPITHNTADLWPTLFSLNPAGWPSRERYTRRFLGEGGNLTDITDPEFRRCIKGQQRRVAKADVLDQLPPKIYSTRYVDLPPKARDAYNDMEQDLTVQVEGGEITAMGALAQLIRLNQLASAAADVSIETVVVDGEEQKVTKVALKAPSWKVDALLEVLSERDGKKTVVFAPSRQLIVLAGRKAKAAGYSVGYIIGDQHPADRTAQIESFQRGEIDVMLATTGAGGVGVTLTAADAVVFLQRPWSFVEAVQAEDRCHRIGSEVHTTIDIIDIVAKDTVDERVRSVLSGKAGALADLLQDKRVALECLGGQA